MSSKRADRAGRNRGSRHETQVLWMVVGTVKLYGVSLLVFVFLHTSIDQSYTAFIHVGSNETSDERRADCERSLSQRLAPFDGQYYIDIAKEGYREFPRAERNSGGSESPPARGNFAFFPLLPAVLRVAAFLSTKPVLVVLVLNWILSGLSAVGMYRLAANLGVSPPLALGFLMAFPTAAFQNILYTESMFLFLSLATIRLWRRGRWLGCGACGFAAGCCRPQGVLLCLFLLGASWESRGGSRPAAGYAWRVVAALAPLAGLASFSTLLWTSIGEPFAFLEVQSEWGRTFLPTDSFVQMLNFHDYAGPMPDLVGVAFGLCCLPFLWRHLPLSFALLGSGAVVVPLATGNLLSFGRFMSVSIPHFLIAAKLSREHPRLSMAVVVSSAALQVMVTEAILEWRFVG